LNIQAAETAEKIYFSFAVERTAKEKNQPLKGRKAKRHSPIRLFF